MVGQLRSKISQRTINPFRIRSAGTYPSPAQSGESGPKGARWYATRVERVLFSSSYPSRILYPFLSAVLAGEKTKSPRPFDLSPRQLKNPYRN